MLDFILILFAIILLIISLWLFRSVKTVVNENDFITSIGLLPDRRLKPILILKTRPTTEIFSELLNRRITPPHAKVEGDMVIGSESNLGSPKKLDFLRKFSLDEEKEFISGHRIRYWGIMKAPHKIYEGDSNNIYIEFKPNLNISNDSEKFVQLKKDGKDISISLDFLKRNSDEYLELELLAAGFEVDGDKRQKQPLNENKLVFQWNCYFKNSGRHSYTLSAFLIGSNKRKYLGRIEQAVRVTKIDHLTQLQVWTLATMAGLISGILATIEILQNLNIL